MSVAAGRLVLCAPSGAGNEVSKVAPLARTDPIRDAYSVPRRYYISVRMCFVAAAVLCVVTEHAGK